MKKKFVTKIFMSYYKGDQSSFDFNSNKNEQFEFQRFQSRIQNQLYFYINGNKKFVVSNTMDCINTLKLCFCVQITEKQDYFTYTVKSLNDIVKQKQQNIYNQSKLIKRRKQDEQKVNYNTVRNIFQKSQPIPNYFYPKFLEDCESQIWFVPRYMKKLQIQLGTNIRLYYEQEEKFKNNQYELKSQDIKVARLVKNYVVKQINPNQIKPNTVLNKLNYCNLIRICDWYEQKLENEEKQNERICYICYQPKDEKICQKSYANIFIDPCGCIGGCKYVHFKCLITWINQKKNDAKLCDMCKKPFPQYLLVRRITSENEKIQKYFPLIGGKQNQPFIELNHIQIKLFSNQQIIIGGLKNDTASYKICVENNFCYATIFYQNMQRVYIQDCKTSFGTLINKKKMTHKVYKQQKQKSCAILFENKWLFYLNLEEIKQ